MKQIQPIQSWHNGQAVEATVLNVSHRYDNLINFAQFDYTLHAEEGGFVLASGTLIMDGDDYNNYTSNDYVWTWAAAKLKLTLVSE